jgi:hypothetical protein
MAKWLGQMIHRQSAKFAQVLPHAWPQASSADVFSFQPTDGTDSTDSRKGYIDVPLLGVYIG